MLFGTNLQYSFFLCSNLCISEYLFPEGFCTMIDLQGFEHDQEGGLSPVFGMGASLCRLCGQIKPRGIGRDSHYLSPSFQQGPLPDSPLFPVDNRSERQLSITQSSCWALSRWTKSQATVLMTSAGLQCCFQLSRSTHSFPIFLSSLMMLMMKDSVLSHILL